MAAAIACGEGRLFGSHTTFARRSLSPLAAVGSTPAVSTDYRALGPCCQSHGIAQSEAVSRRNEFRRARTAPAHGTRLPVPADQVDRPPPAGFLENAIARSERGLSAPVWHGNRTRNSQINVWCSIQLS